MEETFAVIKVDNNILSEVILFKDSSNLEKEHEEDKEDELEE